MKMTRRIYATSNRAAFFREPISKLKKYRYVIKIRMDYNGKLLERCRAVVGSDVIIKTYGNGYMVAWAFKNHTTAARAFSVLSLVL